MSPTRTTRRSFMTSAGLCFVSLFAPPAILPDRRTMPGHPHELILYVGTYTSGRSEGIYLYRMNLSTGELRHFSTVKEIVHPSFLAIDPQLLHLYAVNEVSYFKHKPEGAV